MSSFEERELAFENKFSHEQELEFKAKARRDTLLGLWAGAEMGMTQAEKEAYARAVFEVDMERSGIEKVRDKVYQDLKDSHVEITEYLVEKKMDELLEKARQEIAS